jgi:dolichyl-phosphate beta-glucosyltransferase
MSVLLSIIIPCYNESERIHLTMASLMMFDAAWKDSYEVIIVDDGSKDDMLEKINFMLAHEYSSLSNKIKIISQSNTGKGGALKNGVKNSSGKYFLTLDADMSAEPTELLEWLKIDNHIFLKNEIFIGDRTHPKTKIQALQFRKFSGTIFNLFIKFYTPLKINDTQCGFKLYPSVIGKKIFSALQTNGWAHDVELLCRASKENIKINSMPLSWKNVEQSKVNVWKDSWKMMSEVIRIRQIF